MSEEQKPKRKGNPALYKGMKPLNPAGRPKGSVNKWTKLSRELLSERGPEIVQKVIDEAMKGDKTCLKMCMDRIVPMTKAVSVKHDTSDMGITINVGQIEKKVEEIQEPLEYDEAVIISPEAIDETIVSLATEDDEEDEDEH